jgi:HD superfamily phosphodiesterase
MSLLSKLFHYVLFATSKYGIDDSHGLSHSMNVLHYANKIYEDEIVKYPILKHQDKIIQVSAVLHDMCDKKYMDEIAGIKEIDEFLERETDLTPIEISISKEIMHTMSYSKVKINGFPTLGGYQRAYHIVREADLLTAYDFDRCMIYKMNREKCSIDDAYQNAKELFENRVLKHNVDHLFLLDYSKTESLKLQNIALQRMNHWNRLIY